MLTGLPILLGQLLVRWDYAQTRDASAQRLIEALARHYEREQLYPDSLQELVRTSELDSLPRPHIGFGFLGRPPFAYQGFGTSYLLEFAAPRWVQCAYNPPYPDEDPDEALGGAWSCPSRPPELW